MSITVNKVNAIERTIVDTDNTYRVHNIDIVGRR